MDKQPASKMIRVPTALIKFVVELSRLYRQGKAELLFQELASLIAKIDSGSDNHPNNTVNDADSKLIADLIRRVEHLESLVQSTSSTTDNPRNLSGLTSTQLAKELGISQRQVSRLQQANQLSGWKAIPGKGKSLRYIPADEG
jgi:DNA-directed RNA polymerase specialized sigma subunit